MSIHRFGQALISLTHQSLTSVARPTASKFPILMRNVRSLSDGRPVIFEVENVDDFTNHVVHSQEPVLVDFYADWCGPCKMLGPRLEEKVLGRGGSIRMAKVNVDHAGELAMEYNISAVPTVMAFREGECVASFQGMVSDEEIDTFLDDTAGYSA